MKLLTVVIPCYNSQDYMESCINSLLPGGDRVEILIVDDGSTDRTGSIADAYAARYPSVVQVIHQENGGHGEGINQGLRRATGRYFKVVDSDDCLSGDFPLFLIKLDRLCREGGGPDLVVTNYYYVHSDGIGDRSLHYRNVFPEEKLISWSDSRPFRPHQLLTIHSCTFRTELLRKSGMVLPKHTFYEDNVMIYTSLPLVNTLCYLSMDLYRYTIGREGQSVQRETTMRRYTHQLKVTLLCFRAFHLDAVQNRRLKKYLEHELFTMFGIAILFARLNRTRQAEKDLGELWQACREFDPGCAGRLRHSALAALCIPGKAGVCAAELIYDTAHRVVRFN